MGLGVPLEAGGCVPWGDTGLAGLSELLAPALSLGRGRAQSCVFEAAGEHLTAVNKSLNCRVNSLLLEGAGLLGQESCFSR